MQKALIEEIRERWRDRRWPNIGYFIHGQAVMDIDALIGQLDALEEELLELRTEIGSLECDWRDRGHY